MSHADPSSPSQSGVWTRAEPPRPPQRSTLHAFLGGSPAAVVSRLLILSIVVGALLMWLDIRPEDILFAFERFVRRIWNLGFDAIREIADYLLAGALIVVPLWFIARVLNFRSTH